MCFFFCGFDYVMGCLLGLSADVDGLWVFVFVRLGGGASGGS